MNRTISIVFLVVGAILVVYGISAAESLSSEVSRLFTGAPTDKSIWLLIAGIVAIILGLSGTIFSSKSGTNS